MSLMLDIAIISDGDLDAARLVIRSPHQRFFNQLLKTNLCSAETTHITVVCVPRTADLNLTKT